MKILFYYSDWTANTDRRIEDTYGGVGYYRIKKVFDQVKGHEADIVGAKLTKKDESASDRWERIFTEYDVFWSCYSSHAEDAAAMFYWRDKLKKKVVLDIDDNFWDIPKSHKLYDKLKETKKDRAMIGTILSFADIITCSTEPLKQRIEKHMKDTYGIEKKVVVIPNFNDAKFWKHKAKKPDPKRITIGYAGSNSHNDDIEMVMPAIKNLMEKYPNLYFQTIGTIDKDGLYLFKDLTEEQRGRCEVINASSTFNSYPKRLSQVMWDIVIAPLVDSAFTRCKSHIKFMEYAMYRWPIVASRVYPYFMELKGRQVIEDGVSGLLVKPSEWESAIEELIKNPEKRKMLGENAYNQVVKDWQYDDSRIGETVNEMLSATE